MVAFEEPSLPGPVEISTTVHGLSLIMTYPPFLIEPTWTGVVAGKGSDCSVIVERIFIIIKLFFDYQANKKVTKVMRQSIHLMVIFLAVLNCKLWLLMFFCQLFGVQTYYLMRTDGHRSKIQAVKQQLFDFIFILDTSQLTNPFLQVTMIVLELSFLHYFYINSIFPFLNDHKAFQMYFQSFQKYFIHINAFNSSTLALLVLAIYPSVILVTLIIKKLGPNKILRPIVQIGIYVYPLLQIKIAIEFISACALGQYLYLVVPLGILSFTFGGLLMVISNKSYRVVQYPLILMLELKANIYLVMVSLAIRLLVTGYLLYPTHRHLLGYFYECSLYAVLVACKFCDDQFLNYLGFVFLELTCLAAGAKSLKNIFAKEKTILDYAGQLEDEENQESIYEVYRMIEMHYVDCNIVSCPCQQFYEIGRDGLADWVYKFQEERLRRRECFQGRYEYALKCQSHYEFRLSGLVRVCEGKANSLMEEYKIFKVCSIYQLNLRKQDKNYRYGEPYKNSQEEFQSFQFQISKILRQIRTFWTLITNFDGSTKFLSQILLISRAINHLNKQYQLYESKYDQELRQFKYTYQIFLSIILNQSIIEEDEVIIPEPTSFLITNGQKILNANNSFLLLSSQSRDNLIGSSYNSLIPDVYRDIHNTWASQFIQKVEDFDGKSLVKCLCIGNIQIKIVEMEHKVLPRFLDGLQIYTIVKPSIDHKKQKRDSFIFLVEKESYFIKNVQSAFFEVIKYKINQRNFKILQEMALTSIFENFTIIHSQNPTRQVTIFPHFLQEFTHLKSKKRTQKKIRSSNMMNARGSYLSSQQSKANSLGENQMVFEFSFLPSARKDDPYAKVQFTLKEDKQEDAVSSQEDSSSPHYEGEQQTQNHKPKKQDNFGFFIPYYLVATLCLCHIFFVLGKSSFNSALLDLNNRYQFYLNFDYTTLYVLDAWIGVDKTQELRTYWINGYGDFSESFNAFRRADDSYFLNYFNTQISVNFHNQLYVKIQALMTGSLDSMNIYQIWILIIISLALGHYVVDLILSLRYTFFIESKVGAMLLQFVIIQSRDVREILSMISSFEENILNIQQEYKSTKVPVETVEQSALQLMKGGGISLNNSMALQNEQEQDMITDKRSTYRKKGNSYEDRERMSLSMLKGQFKSSDKRSGFKRQTGIKEEFNGDRTRNINLFKKKYRNFGFIISANKFLYFLIFSGFLINIGIISSSISTMYTPFKYLPLHLQILDALQESRIILLKSQTQILTNSTLSPYFSITTSLLQIMNLMSRISSSYGATNSFNAKLTSYLGSDVCGTVNFNCSLLAGDNNLHKFGVKVIVQYIEDYLRMKNISLIKSNNLQNQLIAYTMVLYTNLIQEFMTDSQVFREAIQQAELKMLIIGSIGLLLGMFLVHYSLREFKNRIENSQNLLKIIPKEIKKKQQKDIEELTLKELSTP